MIKAVVFDCFGVLTQDGWLAFLQTYADDTKLEELRYLNHQADRGLLSYQDFLQQVSNLTGAPKEKIHEMISAQLHPNVKLLELAEQIKSNGYKLGIISNVGRGLEEYIGKESLELFDCVTLSYKVGSLKPAPQIYETHCEQLGLKPEETVFIDDRSNNVQGAEAVGMHAILYIDFDSLKQQLRELGIAV